MRQQPAWSISFLLPLTSLPPPSFSSLLPLHCHPLSAASLVPALFVTRSKGFDDRLASRQWSTYKNLHRSDAGDVSLAALEPDPQRRAKSLDVLAMYREGRKPAVVQRLLRDSLSSNHHVFPCFGRSEFFELVIRNPFNHEERFAVRVDDPLHELKLVIDPDHCHFLRSALPRKLIAGGVPATSSDALPTGAHTPSYHGDTAAAEDATFTKDGEILIGPQETVRIPLLFLSLAAGMVNARAPMHSATTPADVRALTVLGTWLFQLVGVAVRLTPCFLQGTLWTLITSCCPLRRAPSPCLWLAVIMAKRWPS